MILVTHELRSIISLALSEHGWAEVCGLQRVPYQGLWLGDLLSSGTQQTAESDGQLTTAGQVVLCQTGDPTTDTLPIGSLSGQNESRQDSDDQILTEDTQSDSQTLPADAIRLPNSVMPG